MALHDSNEIINILFTIDHNYFAPALVTLKSLNDNLASGTRLRVFIITENINRKSFDPYLDKLSNVESVTILIAPANLEKYGLVLPPHVTISTAFRLFLADLVPTEIDKLIYLDGDLLVLGDISDLWHQNTDLPLAAVQDGHLPWFGLIPGYISSRKEMLHFKYFNAGVMLINLVEWRKMSFGRNAVEILKSHGRNLSHSDQDCLNDIFKNNWLPLPAKWNLFSLAYYWPGHEYSPYQPEEFREAIENPKIVHFVGPSKPWLGFDHGDISRRYHEYARAIGVKFTFPRLTLDALLNRSTWPIMAFIPLRRLRWLNVKPLKVCYDIFVAVALNPLTILYIIVWAFRRLSTHLNPEMK